MLSILLFQKRSIVSFRLCGIQQSRFFGTRKYLQSPPHGFSDSDQVDSITLRLTEDENQLFGMFRSVVEDQKLATTVRVAGGWVRDKVLGLPSKNDIDISLDNMTGKDFTDALNRWIGNSGKQISIGVIQQNPDKSKHLETVTGRIGNFYLDFVNLRTETYSANSRIPQVEIGTPVEDAMRRDLTINSLFYNIHTGKVEDFTGKGLNDIRDGIVRTPLPALVTLQDDPLRALRVVRFACRFNFDIAEDLITAFSNDQVREALQRKVSKERVTAELHAMFKHHNAIRAAYLLYSFDLLPIIMDIPANIEVEEHDPLFKLIKKVEKDQNISHYVNEYFMGFGISSMLVSSYLLGFSRISKKPSHLSFVASYPRFKEMIQKISRGEDDLRIFSYASLAVGTKGYMQKNVLKKSSTVLNGVFFQDKLRFSAKDSKIICHIQESSDLFYNLIDKSYNYLQETNDKLETKEINISLNIPSMSLEAQYCTNISCEVSTIGPINRLFLGRALRKTGDSYKSAILLATVKYFIDKMLVKKCSKSIEGVDIIKEEIKEILNDWVLLNNIKVSSNVFREVKQALKNFENLENKNIEKMSKISPPIKARIFDKYENDLNEILAAVELILLCIDQMKLDNIWEMKPLIPGNVIVKIFPNIPSRPLISAVSLKKIHYIFVYFMNYMFYLMFYRY